MNYRLFENLSPEVQQKLLIKREEGLSYRDCSGWLEQEYNVIISHESIRRGIQRYQDQLDFQKASDEEKSAEEKLVRQAQHDRELESERSKRKLTEKLYRIQTKQTALEDRMMESFSDIHNIIQTVPAEPYEVPSDVSNVQSAIAPLCDTHIGEYVDIEQMSGLNSYNLRIFNERLYGWASTILELVHWRRSYAHVPVLYVPMLGDMISGDIHEELVETNEMAAMMQMINGAHLISQALAKLAPSFEKIIVPCVVGNHGRMKKKPPSKNRYLSWDYMMYQHMAHFTRNFDNIEFIIPKSFMHKFTVENREILMMHGDSIRGALGIPYYGIARAISALRGVFQFRNTEDRRKRQEEEGKLTLEEVLKLSGAFDSMMIGHFHTQNELDAVTGEVFVCGCMKGGDDYALGRLHTISRPKQILTYWNKTNGYIGKEIVYLDRFDGSGNHFQEELPNVWSNVDVSQESE